MIEYIERSQRQNASASIKPGGKHGRFGECRPAPPLPFHLRRTSLTADGSPPRAAEFGVRPRDRRRSPGGEAAQDIDLAVKAARGPEEACGRRSSRSSAARWWAPGRSPQHLVELAEIEAATEAGQRRQGLNLPFGCDLRYGRLVDQITGQHSICAGRLARLFDAQGGVVGQMSRELPALMAVEDRAALARAAHRVEACRADAARALRLGVGHGGGLPARVLNIVTGDGVPGAALAAHPDVDKVVPPARPRSAS
jgi:acyl-CoA reductase-like NAD-dependent aldehyde dehydrogenase